ncbi:MAG: glycosyltransferase family 2 protein [Thermoanaerobaculia bacterium]
MQGISSSTESPAAALAEEDGRVQARIAVVIPCFKVKKQILQVLAAIGPECEAVYVVDDACPEGTADLVASECTDRRVRVLRHERNRGVGSATMTGYRAAIDGGSDVIVKLDGDGQMDPSLIPRLVRPILDGEADYTKGNRFFEPDGLRDMPRIRLLGNALLSFASKLSSGYWHLFDPTNGFTALHAAVAAALPLEKISRRWFFESDLLFRLGTLRAVVVDVPMAAVYATENSSLVIHRLLFEFSWKHVANTVKRILYGYYLRDFNIASLEILFGVAFLVFGTWVGVTEWWSVARSGVVASSGTVMLAALPVMIGVQLVLAFFTFDMHNVPRDSIHRKLTPDLD